jgi:hypothetical protein
VGGRSRRQVLTCGDRQKGEQVLCQVRLFSHIDEDITGQLIGRASRAVLMKFPQALDLWEGGIRATGGAIVPEKSHWYLIDFK